MNSESQFIHNFLGVAAHLVNDGRQFLSSHLDAVKRPVDSISGSVDQCHADYFAAANCPAYVGMDVSVPDVGCQLVGNHFVAVGDDFAAARVGDHIPR